MGTTWICGFDRTNKEGSTSIAKRIALVHAVTAAMEPISDAFGEFWPEAECSNILDDSLPGDLERSGGLTPAIFGRFDALGNYAADLGADGLLFTCSAFGDAIDAVARKARFPVLKPNNVGALIGVSHEDGLNVNDKKGGPRHGD